MKKRRLEERFPLPPGEGQGEGVPLLEAKLLKHGMPLKGEGELLRCELIDKHSVSVTRHSGESRNPENAKHREHSRRPTSLDSGFRRNDGIVYQFIHASVKGPAGARERSKLNGTYPVGAGFKPTPTLR